MDSVGVQDQTCSHMRKRHPPSRKQWKRVRPCDRPLDATMVSVGVHDRACAHMRKYHPTSRKMWTRARPCDRPLDATMDSVGVHDRACTHMRKQGCVIEHALICASTIHPPEKQKRVRGSDHAIDHWMLRWTQSGCAIEHALECDNREAVNTYGNNERHSHQQHLHQHESPSQLRSALTTTSSPSLPPP